MGIRAKDRSMAMLIMVLFTGSSMDLDLSCERVCIKCFEKVWRLCLSVCDFII